MMIKASEYLIALNQHQSCSHLHMNEMWREVDRVGSYSCIPYIACMVFVSFLFQNLNVRISKISVHKYICMRVYISCEQYRESSSGDFYYLPRALHRTPWHRSRDFNGCRLQSSTSPSLSHMKPLNRELDSSSPLWERTLLSAEQKRKTKKLASHQDTIRLIAACPNLLLVQMILLLVKWSLSGVDGFETFASARKSPPAPPTHTYKFSFPMCNWNCQTLLEGITVHLLVYVHIWMLDGEWAQLLRKVMKIGSSSFVRAVRDFTSKRVKASKVREKENVPPPGE